MNLQIVELLWLKPVSEENIITISMRPTGASLSMVLDGVLEVRQHFEYYKCSFGLKIMCHCGKYGNCHRMFAYACFK